jgi:hypothetical protein
VRLKENSIVTFLKPLGDVKMKKLIVAVSTTIILGSAGAVLAKDPKASICHNGSTYNEGTQVEDPISFVITIAGRSTAKAVEKHVENHEDLETYQVGEEGGGLECELLEDGLMTVECDVVTLCEEVETV